MTQTAVFASSHHWNSALKLGAHHCARLLLNAGWRVAFIADPISPLHLARLRTTGEMRERFSTWWCGGANEYDGRLFYYTPFTWRPHLDMPLCRSAASLRRWSSSTKPSLMRVIEEQQFLEPDLLFIGSVQAGSWTGSVNAKKTVVRVADDIAGFKGVTPAMLEMERQLIQTADMVVYTASELLPMLQSRGAKVLMHVPNGVEYDHFVRARDEPADLRARRHPRLLYVGAVDHWFDVELVDAIASGCPDADIILVGPVRTDMKQLGSRRNVFILGPKPYDDVPGYMQHCDVGLIPFTPSDMVQAVHPIKMYEYMAAGLPTVSIRWREIERLKPPCELVDTPDAFVAAIRRQLASPPDRETLRAYARAADWRERLRQMMDTLGIEI